MYSIHLLLDCGNDVTDASSARLCGLPPVVEYDPELWATINSLPYIVSGRSSITAKRKETKMEKKLLKRKFHWQIMAFYSRYMNFKDCSNLY